MVDNVDFISPMDGIGEYKTPGQLLRALLASRGWTQRVLSMVSGINPATVNQILVGKKRVDADLAIILGEVFDVSAEAFLELQKRYDLAHAKIVSQPDPSRARRARLLGDLPIAEMVKRGWLTIHDPKNLDEIESSLVKFFGVSSPDEIEILPHATKKTAVHTPPTPAQLAWLYRVKQIARDMLVAKYSPAALKNAIHRLEALLFSAEESRHVPRILARAGVRFVIVEALASTKIDGVCFWLDSNSPVIGMSLRYDRIDNFWFVLRHEIEHLLRLHGQVEAMLDTDLEGERAGVGENVLEEERVANEAASNFCVPAKALEQFIARKDPLFHQRDILGFARTHKIHPGLVAGQLQYRTDAYQRFRNHLVKIRHIVTPNAIVDGWGDVASVDC